MAARVRASVGSPKIPKSPWAGEPMPTPNTVRPPASRSSVTVCRASTHGRRRGTGVIIGPSTIVEVCAAATDSTAHGSTIGGPWPSLAKTMWSQTKNPSKPARSASTASRTSSYGSSAKHGAATPRLIVMRPAWASSAASDSPRWSVVSMSNAAAGPHRIGISPGPWPGCGLPPCTTMPTVR